MSRFLIAIGLLFLPTPGFSQDLDLSNLNIISIEQVDAQKTYNFEPLKELLSNKRIVLLGEQTHGDGATFDAKVKLIKFLHSELGFDMVAFESPMYSIYKANKLAEDSENSRLINESVVGVWAETKQFQQLLEYRNNTIDSKHTLVFAGFDIQEDLIFEEYFFDDLIQTFDGKQLYLNDSTIEILKKTFFGGSDYIVKNKVDSVIFYDAVEKVKSCFWESREQNEHSQIIQQSFLGYLAGIEFQADIMKGKEIKVQNPRDLQMAKNLIFLSELYPDKKIIGWGASYHFANEVEKYQLTDLTKTCMKQLAKEQNEESRDGEYNLEANLGGAIPMGKILKNHFGDQIYSVAFSSYEGTHGKVEEKSNVLITPPKGSIESKLNTANYKYAFVDYNQIDTAFFYSSALGYLPILAPWQDIFDGLFYIKTAYPPDFISYQEANLDEFLNKKSIQLNGRVIDAKSKQGIPYVHIAIENTSTGTVTNDAGYFTFNFNQRDSVVGKILFSAVGYKSSTITLTDKRLTIDTLTISLEPEIIMLDEVVISEKFLSVDQIVMKARESIENNYYQNPFNQEVFCRVVEKTADSVSFKEEATFLTYFDNGIKGTTNPVKHIFGEILQFRNVTQNHTKEAWSGIGGMWLVYSHNLIMNKNNVLYKTSDYEFEVTNVTKYNGEDVYEITFINKKPSFYNTGYGRPAPISSHGKLFINAENFAVLRHEHCIKRKSFNPSKKRLYKMDNIHYKIIDTFKPYNGKYYLHHTKHVYLSDKVNLKTQESEPFSKSLDILSSEIHTGDVLSLKKPIAHIKTGIIVEKDSEFWNTHNIVLEDIIELDICVAK